MAAMYSPFVYWGQTKHLVTLKVDLRDVESPEVNLDEDKLEFEATGYGVRGVNNYSFNLEFYLPIDPDKSKYKVTGNSIVFQLQKRGVGETWPRLTVEQKKPAWLKIDFDHFAFEDDTEEEDMVDGMAPAERDMMERLEKELFESEKNAYVDLRTLYIFMYNFFQWIGFCLVFGIIAFRYFREGEESKKGTYAAVSQPLTVVQLAALFEIANVTLGWVKGGLLPTCLQVLGRNFVLFGIITAEPAIQESDCIWLLFIAWSSVELVRYPYYMMKTINKEVSIITWLRYTMWIPLYPLGFVCEGTVLLIALPFFEKSGNWTLQLPNSYNMAFHFPTFMRIYMLGLLGGSVVMMKYMYQQRKKKLGTGGRTRLKSKSN